MNESFLHYIWKFRLFDAKSLRSSNDEALEIIKPGEHNTDGGPDFTNARIKIGSTTWAGNVEIHLDASDWIKHKHHKDKSYDNIILHVVNNNDFTATRSNKEPIPVLELKDIIPQSIYNKYQSIIESKQWIPCQKHINHADSIIISAWLDRLLVERLQNKAESIHQLLRLNKNNWEQTFYIYLAKNFGFKLNAVPFELLAKNTPINYLTKHKNNLLQLEAMLFGQAGLIGKNFHEKYTATLHQEYTVLKQKFGLIAISGHLWKFFRLHPSGFPTIRVAQFASLIHKSLHLFSKILEAKKLHELEELFDAECSEYWQTHYVFGKESPTRSKKLGKTSTENLIINTVVPFLFVYGEIKKEDKYKERAIKFLEQLEGEKNALITKWKYLEMPVKTAAHTQALLELKNNYCLAKRCLNCVIGAALLKS